MSTAPKQSNYVSAKKTSLARLAEEIINNVSEIWRTVNKRIMPWAEDDVMMELSTVKVTSSAEIESIPVLIAVYRAPDYEKGPEEAGIDYVIFKLTTEKARVHRAELACRRWGPKTLAGLEVVVGDSALITVPPGSLSEAFTLAGSPELSEKLETLAREWGAEDAVKWFETVKELRSKVSSNIDSYLPAGESGTLELVVAVAAGKLLRNIGVGIGIVPDLRKGFTKERYYVIETKTGRVLSSKRTAKDILLSLPDEELEAYANATERARTAVVLGTVALRVYWENR